MKMLIITNRKINRRNATNEDLFGEQVNDRGASELRLAWAEKGPEGNWHLELIREPSRLTRDNLPSQFAFRKYIALLTRDQKDCVFYVHGFNKAFVETLEQSHDIQQQYDVGVVTFSWPSNPGGFFVVDEYKQARAIASNSIVALDRTLEKMEQYLCRHGDEDCQISFNLLVHSLGNFMFEKFIRDPIFTGETRIFDNIVLNAADVDLRTHPEWTNALRYSRRVYATINERDSILNFSDIVNPDRLGNTADRLTSNQVTYFDLTDGDNVNKRHQHFGTTAAANDVVLAFFKRIFRGASALPLEGAEFNPQINAYQLIDRESQWIFN